MDTTIDTPRALLTPRHIRVEHIMGMPIGIDVRAPAIDPAALEAAFDWLRWVDATFSTYRPDSAINRLNRRELAEEEAHPHVGAVLAQCRALARETDGYFDMCVAIGPHDRRDDAVLALGAVDDAICAGGGGAASVLAERIRRGDNPLRKEPQAET